MIWLVFRLWFTPTLLGKIFEFFLCLTKLACFAIKLRFSTCHVFTTNPFDFSPEIRELIEIGNFITIISSLTKTKV